MDSEEEEDGQDDEGVGTRRLFSDTMHSHDHTGGWKATTSRFSGSDLHMCDAQSTSTDCSGSAGKVLSRERILHMVRFYCVALMEEFLFVLH